MMLGDEKMKAEVAKTQATEERLLTVAAVAERLSLSKRGVFRMKSAGLICPSIRVGRGAIRFRESDIALWISLACPDRRTFEVMKGAEDVK